MDDQRREISFSGQIDHDRPAQRSPVSDNSGMIDVVAGTQIIVSGNSVLVNTRFAGSPLAFPVSAIIDNKDIHPHLVKQQDFLQAVADISGIAVAENKRAAAQR